MYKNRQDAWEQKEDNLLAETVIAYIKNGGTQLQAFEEVGFMLGRTGAACGFRWNKILRKQYTQQISLAKQIRREGKNKRNILKQVSQDNQNGKEIFNEDSINYVIEVLRDFSKLIYKKNEIEERYIQLEKEFVHLKKDHERIHQELNDAKQGLNEYDTLLRILRQTHEDQKARMSG